MQESPKNQSIISKGRGYYAYILLFLLYMFDYIDRQVVVSVFPFLKSDWGLSDMQCGMLVSAVYWSIIIFTFPVSILIDRWSRKNSIAIMAIFWSIASVLCAFTRNFSQLFITRTAIGIGEAGYAPGGATLISATFPKAKRALVLGIWNAAIPLGIAIGTALGGFIAELWGWRHAFGIVAIPGLIIAMMFFWVKDFKTVSLDATLGNTEGKPGEKVGAANVAKDILSNKALLLTYFGFAASVFVTTSLSTWLPSYFQRTYNIPAGQAGFMGGMVMLTAIIGAPLGGFLADLWMKKTQNGRSYFIALSSLTTSIILFFAFTVLQGTVQYVSLIFAGLTAVAFVSGAMAIIQDVSHPGLRATYFSLNVVIQNLLGSSLGPIFIGFISDRFDLGVAMAFMPVFSLIAAALFFATSSFYPQAAKKVEIIEGQIQIVG
jgi:MFS family permease